jgi:hypothetical protein
MVVDRNQYAYMENAYYRNIIADFDILKEGYVTDRNDVISDINPDNIEKYFSGFTTKRITKKELKRVNKILSSF